jgi:hypothetical protein
MTYRVESSPRRSEEVLLAGVWLLARRLLQPDVLERPAAREAHLAYQESLRLKN